MDALPHSGGLSLLLGGAIQYFAILAVIAAAGNPFA